MLATLRSLRSAPGFTSTALITLILGIGATTAIFSVVYAVLFRPLPYRDPAGLVHIVADEPGDLHSGVPYALFDLLRERSATLGEVAAYYRNTGWSRVIVGGGKEPETVQAGYVSAGIFSLLGARPSLGRVFDEAEARRADPVAVISHALWLRRFGGGSAVLGQSLEVDDKPFTVIGVMPEEFRFPARETRLWLPITTNRYWLDAPTPDDLHARGFFMRWNLVARLRGGSSAGDAQGELAALASRLAERDKGWNMGLPVKLRPLSVEIGERPKLALELLLAAVFVVLLIACTNVANLLLARGAARSRELAIRLALGASQSRIARQILSESLLLVAVAAGAALPLAHWIVRLLVRSGPPGLPRLEDARLDGSVLAFALGVSLLTALLFGLGPALHAARSDPQAGLRSGAGRNVSSGDSQANRLLIVAEFALAVVLVTSAGLLLRSLWQAETVDLGFQPARILTMRLEPPAAISQSRRAALFDQVRERLASIPGVEKVGGIRGLFEIGAAPTNSLRAVEGEPAKADTGRPLTWTTVSGEYFRAMGIPLLAGRLFSDHDDEHSSLVAVIDQSMARRYWPERDPIGRRFKGQDRRGRNDDWITVIGLVRDARRQGVEQDPTPHVFLWHRQSETTADWVIRTRVQPEALAAGVRAAVREIDPRTVIASVLPMEAQLDMQTAERRFQTWLIALFAALALTLAAVGIFGVMSHAAVRRTHEIGIRMALGADRGEVIRMILRQGAGLASVGLAAGIALAMVATQLLSGLLYGVAATDLATFAAAGLTLLVVAVAATLVPAWRASGVEPLTALRRE